MPHSPDLIADAWLRFEVAARSRGDRKLEDSAAMQHFWSAELMTDLASRDPWQLWSVVVAIWSRVDRRDMHLLGALGAGPVEDLLVHHGDEFFPVIEVFCQHEPDFKTVLRMVWQSSMSPQLWQKVQDLRGGPNL